MCDSRKKNFIYITSGGNDKNSIIEVAWPFLLKWELHLNSWSVGKCIDLLRIYAQSDLTSSAGLSPELFAPTG